MVFPPRKNSLQNRISNAKFAWNQIVSCQTFFCALYGRILCTVLVCISPFGAKTNCNVNRNARSSDYTSPSSEWRYTVTFSIRHRRFVGLCRIRCLRSISYTMSQVFVLGIRCRMFITTWHIACEKNHACGGDVLGLRSKPKITQSTLLSIPTVVNQ